MVSSISALRAMLVSEPVLAFERNGRVEAVSIDTLVNVVKPFASEGLELVVLTGCCTARLGAALRESAEVPHVICWETQVDDAAAKIFGEALARDLALQRSNLQPELAFGSACTAVTLETEPGQLDTGSSAWVQKFELNVDPNDRSRVDPGTGRLRAKPGAPRGRFAAGTPKLLRRHDHEPVALGEAATSISTPCTVRTDTSARLRRSKTEIDCPGSGSGDDCST